MTPILHSKYSGRALCEKDWVRNEKFQRVPDRNLALVTTAIHDTKTHVGEQVGSHLQDAVVVKLVRSLSG